MLTDEQLREIQDNRDNCEFEDCCGVKRLLDDRAELVARIARLEAVAERPRNVLLAIIGAYKGGHEDDAAKMFEIALDTYVRWYGTEATRGDDS